jgi:acyl-coenzyme A thioesterase PaaI-like protein
MSHVLALWQKWSVKPFGKRIFSFAVCRKAPYFSSIKPRFDELRAGFARVSMKKCRAVENHIRSVHAIAMCNLAEIAAGTMMEASLSSNMRWLPRGMTVQYLKVAKTGVYVEAASDDIADGPARDVIVKCDIKDTEGNIVCHADIAMYVSPRKAK